MGQADAQTTLVDQEGVKQDIPNIKPQGTFLPTPEVKKAVGNGPMFEQQNKVAQVGKSDIKIQTEPGYKMLDGFDIRRLGSILAQEAIKIGNLDPERVTENDRKKVLRALYALNHKKYPFDIPDDEVSTPEEIDSPVEPPKEKVIAKSPDFFKKRQADAIESQSNKSGVLRAGKLGTPKLTLVRARRETREELTKLEEQKPKVDLFEALHKPTKPEIISPTVETVPVPPTENKINIETNVSQDKAERTKAVASLFDVVTKSRGNNWMNLAVPISFGVTNNNPHEDQMIPQNMHMEQIISWRESPRIKEISDFINSLSKLTEEQLIAKYTPSYVTPSNPASWSSVSGFSANEIIHGEESVYGIMHDTRLEISTLLKNLGTIDEETDGLQPLRKYTGTDINTYQEYISLSPKLTIHDYYEEIRRRIVEADKKENR